MAHELKEAAEVNLENKKFVLKYRGISLELNYSELKIKDTGYLLMI